MSRMSALLVSDIEGVPDGIRTDEKGNLYVAAKGVAVYTPEGKLLNTIPLAETPSNCAFGDADLQTFTSPREPRSIACDWT